MERETGKDRRKKIKLKEETTVFYNLFSEVIHHQFATCCMADKPWYSVGGEYLRV